MKSLNRGGAGFTLLEVCLAMSISMVLIAAAVPYVVGVLREQRLKRSFEKFDAFVQVARTRSAEERRSYVISWRHDEIMLAPRNSGGDGTQEDEARASGDARFRFDSGENYSLERPAALVSHPIAEWEFWPGGISEPATISYQGNDGTWRVSYQPLSGRGVFLDSQVR